MQNRPARSSRRPLLLILTGLAIAGLVAVLIPGAAPARSAYAFPRYGAHNDVSTPFNVSHIPTLARTRFDGGQLRIRSTLWETPGHRMQEIVYRSAGRQVTGSISVPQGPGPFPVVVMAHGYVDPAVYFSGATLEREQAYLADAGYVVVQTDYRNHGGSFTERRGRTVRRPKGYAEDLINLVRAVRSARLPYADTSRLALFGRSMGGGVVLNALAARPRLAHAAVLYSPLSASMTDNYRHFVGTRRTHRQLSERIEGAFGTPRTRPRYWRQISSDSYLHRITIPVQIHHGLADAKTLPRWSRRTASRLKAGGAPVDLRFYAGEAHKFSSRWSAFMHSTRTFLDHSLGRV